MPEPYWLVEGLFGAAKGDYTARYLGGKRLPEEEANKVVAATRDKPGTITKLEKKEEREQPGPALRPDLAPAPREHALRVLGAPHARRPRSASTRSTRRSPTRARARGTCQATSSRRSGRPPSSSARTRSTRRRREYVTGARGAAARPRRQRREGDRPPRDHPDPLRARPREDGRGRAQDLRPVAKRFLAVFFPEAVWERTRVETTVEEHVFRTSGRVLDHGRLARGLRRGGAAERRRRGRHRRRPAAAAPRARRDRRDEEGRRRSARRRSRRGASRRPRSSVRWRRPARTSTTPSCARR